jgi:Fic family protein
LVHAALAHAQFETIHPFADGNGRTGRSLIHAMLRAKSLVRHTTIPISAGLLTNTPAYFDALTSYRRGDVVCIVSRLTDACFAAVANARRLVDDLRTVRSDWDRRIAARADSTGWRLADLLLRRPVVDASVIAAELGVRTGNVRRYVEPLVAADVLRESTGRRRNRIWRCDEVLAAVDAFSTRAGRRTGG